MFGGRSAAYSQADTPTTRQVFGTDYMEETLKCRKCGYQNDFLKKCPFHQPQSEIDEICKERDRKEAELKSAKNTEQANQPDSGE